MWKYNCRQTHAPPDEESDLGQLDGKMALDRQDCKLAGPDLNLDFELRMQQGDGMMRESPEHTGLWTGSAYVEIDLAKDED